MLTRKRLPLALLTIGVGFFALSFEMTSSRSLLIWTGICFVWVSYAYLTIESNCFGKRPDGTLPITQLLMLAPYFALSWVLWYASGLLSRDNKYDEVLPHVWVGRRPLGLNLPPNVTRIVDLTAEFGRISKRLVESKYTCLPILDHSVPNFKQSVELIDDLKSYEGTVFVHCAEGHGRSGLVVAVLAIATAKAHYSQSAIDLVRLGRLGIRLNDIQMEM